MKSETFLRTSAAAICLIFLLMSGREVRAMGAGPEMLDISTTEFFKPYNDPDSGKYLVEFTYPGVFLGTEDQEKYPRLASAVDALRAEIETQAEAEYAEYTSAALERFTESPEYFDLYLNTNEFSVRRADSVVLSLLGTYETYMGGAHGMHGHTAVTFDTATGKRLALQDVSTDVDALLREVDAQVRKDYPDLSFMNGDDMISAKNLEYFSWTLESDGITFYFDPYLLGAYAEGSQCVRIPFRGNEQLFKTEYLMVPGNYAWQFPDGDLLIADLDGDGETERGSVWASGNENGAFDSFDITVGGSSYTETVYHYDRSAVFIHTMSGDFVYMELFFDNDYRQIYVYEITGGTVRKAGETDLGLRTLTDGYPEGFLPTRQLTDPGHFELQTRTDALSTSNAWRHYHVGEDGLPVPEEDWFYITNARNLTLKRALAVNLVDEGGSSAGSADLPAGTSLALYRTDDASYVDLKLTDGRIARIPVSLGSWPIIAAGMDAQELFDGMMFAG